MKRTKRANNKGKRFSVYLYNFPQSQCFLSRWFKRFLLIMSFFPISLFFIKLFLSTAAERFLILCNFLWKVLFKNHVIHANTYASAFSLPIHVHIIILVLNRCYKPFQYQEINYKKWNLRKKVNWIFWRSKLLY